MPLDPMIARPYVPDFGNTLGEIARMRQADQYRNALMQRDDRQFAFEQQKYQAQQSEAEQLQDMQRTFARMEAGDPTAFQYAVEKASQTDPGFAQFAKADPQAASKAIHDILRQQLGVPAKPGPIQYERTPWGGQIAMQDGKKVADWNPPQPQQYGPESYSTFTDANGKVWQMGSRGTIRPTNLTGKVQADPAEAKAAEAKTAADTAFNVYETGMAGVKDSLSKTRTGPIAGRLPAMTADAQSAEGAISAMAPVLKQMFRSAGEGVWTDKDQQTLMDMLPTRKDLPAARDYKVWNIDNIVRVKLGKPPLPAPEVGDDALPVYSPEQAAMLPSGTRFKGADGKVRTKK